ncbi:RNA polymerase sigma factor [Elioraea rosea]|uniref:RNA polymerase sigma factor n=1 Tax=Elioraea rosea TaxID=2492390 RepID=UPI00131586BF|nr:sigma-70 family RNA polymerase sigma factor [Elioraea rosea]
MTASPASLHVPTPGYERPEARCDRPGAPNARGAVFGIEDELVAALPRLRRYARHLTGNPSDADDLLQDSVLRMLRASNSYQPGTHFQAWACTVMRNHFISSFVRTASRTVNVDDIDPELIQGPATQTDGLECRDLAKQFSLLPLQGQSMLALAHDGMRYDQVASVSGCTVQAVKSRVHRTRRMLRAMLESAYTPSPCATRPGKAVLQPLVKDRACSLAVG